MTTHQGGCLCGALRFETTQDPVRVTVCHCAFCLRATGGAYMVEPIFDTSAFRITRGRPKTFDLVSEGSGKVVHVHFCPDCGTKLNLTFERFADVVGIYAGTFDDPDWFAITPANARHIFLDEARPDTVIPAGLPTFARHATSNEGETCVPTIYDSPHPIGHR